MRGGGGGVVAPAKSKDMQEMALAWLECSAKRSTPPITDTIMSAPDIA